MSHWDDAEKAYDYAVRSNPLDANYYCNLGGVVARRDISKAIELLQEGLRLNPEFGEVSMHCLPWKVHPPVIDRSIHEYVHRESGETERRE